MNNKNFYILKKGNPEIKTVRNKLFSEINSLIDSGKNFQVEIADVKQDKTTKQLRGIHRLFNVIASYLREAGNIKYNKDVVKQIVKIECGFTEEVKGVMITKSFKFASISEMREIIEYTQAWGISELGIADCHLTPQEEEEIEDSYMSYG